MTFGLGRQSGLEIVLVKGWQCSNFAAGALVPQQDSVQMSHCDADFPLSSLVVMAADSGLSVAANGV